MLVATSCAGKRQCLKARDGLGWTRSRLLGRPCRQSFARSGGFAGPTKPVRKASGTLTASQMWEPLVFGKAPKFRAADILGITAAARSLGAMRSRIRGLYGFMCADRQFSILGHRFTTNVSNVCGHGSFIMLALGYMESDVLLLRGYAATGIALSVLFQYYRPIPLWIPISWNGLFLLINAGMIALLINERRDATKMDSEQAAVFEAVFAPLGLSPVEFMKLVHLADRKCLASGSYLTRAGRVQEDLYLILDGKATISKEDEEVGRIGKPQFVGSMSFLRFYNANGNGGEEDQAAEGPGGAERGGQHVVATSAPTYMPRALLARVTQAPAAVAANSSRECDVPCSYVVRASTDMVVYAWNFHLLRAYLKRHPVEGNAMHTCISSDLTRKVDQSRSASERYRAMLSMALSGGEVTPMEKRKLSQYRCAHGVSAAQHSSVLTTLGWTKDEYEAGYQRQAVPQAFVRYEEMVRDELRAGKVSDAGRSRLRRYRSRSGIAVEEHLLALYKQGWTADEYEAGVKHAPRKVNLKQYVSQVIGAE